MCSLFLIAAKCYFFLSVFFLILSRHPSNPMIYSNLIASQIDNLFSGDHFVIICFVFFSLFCFLVFFLFLKKKNLSLTAYSTTKSFTPSSPTPTPYFPLLLPFFGISNFRIHQFMSGFLWPFRGRHDQSPSLNIPFASLG